MSWPAGGGGADCCKRTQEAREVRLAQMWAGWGSSSKFRYLNPVTCVAHILSQRIKRFFLVTPGIVRGSFSSLPQQMGSSALKSASIVLTSSVESRSEKPSQTDGCKFFFVTTDGVSVETNYVFHNV